MIIIIFSIFVIAIHNYSHRWLHHKTFVSSRSIYNFTNDIHKSFDKDFAIKFYYKLTE